MSLGSYEDESQTAEIHGSLVKPGRVISRYITRFYVVKGPLLAYYETTRDPHPKKMLVLSNAKIAAVMSKDGLRSGFVLQFQERSHTFYAQDEGETRRWIGAIENAISGHQSRKSRRMSRKGSIGMPPNFNRTVSRIANRVEDLYDLKEELGSGGFSVVRRGVCKEDNQSYALKMIQMSVFLKNKARTDEEVHLLAALDHPNIVRLKEVVRTPKYFVISMELLTGGELFDRIVSREKYSEHDAKMVAVRMIEAVRYLHENNICHRDLKPENLIFDRPGDNANLKLTDFGFATLYDPAQKLTSTCGTPEYVAPEILDEKPYGLAVDMWSCGVIIYILLCGFPPFYADNEQDLFDKICACDFQFLSPYWDRVSAEAKDLINRLLEVDPTKRLTAEEAMDHDWLKKEAADLDSDLFSAIIELSRYNATRKFRKGVLAVLAANKLSIILREIEDARKE
eukprot:c12430_g1_i3.p1 GENE.c12430_g1_i3~~c12430_g1_i3.p1  ORF type:complete len:454 (-),score=79.80 c12430_g1_i3:1644-3005(-)